MTKDNREHERLHDALLLGETIRNARLQKNITQAELAAKANINESYVSAIENGYSFVSMSKYLAICDALEIHPADLLDMFILKKLEGKKG